VPTFVGRVESPDGKGAQSFVELPPELVAGLGRGKKPPIKLTLKSYTYRTTVAVYGGQYLVPVRREVREAAGIIFDEPIEITVELDKDERTVDIPSQLTAAFEADPELRRAFDRLAFTARKELVGSLVTPKREDTRRRNLERALERLRQPH
jgi:Bacteriocin-protection, YdeI or OmpD-Associated/Domain of unknown function (DUF1905)